MRSGSISFIVISALLVAAIYSSSMSVVFALPPRNGYVDTCTETGHYSDGTPKSVTCCVQFYLDGKPYAKPTCSKTCYNRAGNEITCPKKTAEEDMVDPGLLGGGTLKGESQNTTKVPKSGLLNDGGLLKGEGDNQTTSQRIVNPEDRFCLQGTGERFGTPCIPCNPGKGNCIDQVIGGLLGMPDTATSEPGKGNDTNPKDLGGSNNDDNGPQLNPGE